MEQPQVDPLSFSAGVPEPVQSELLWLCLTVPGPCTLEWCPHLRLGGSVSTAAGCRLPSGQVQAPCTAVGEFSGAWFCRWWSVQGAGSFSEASGATPGPYSPMLPHLDVPTPMHRMRYTTSTAGCAMHPPGHAVHHAQCSLRERAWPSLGGRVGGSGGGGGGG